MIKSSIRALRMLWAGALLTFFFVGAIQAQGWRGIKPLRSTRGDVERLIGPPMRPNDSVYDLPNERVSVSYADVPCTGGWPFGWNVAPGTVIGITISPQPRLKLAELPIDISKAKKYVDPSGVIHYNNDYEGVSIAVDPRGYEVQLIEYYPATSDSDLRCPEAAARESEIARGESVLRAPDVFYSDSSPEEEQRYLNAFADQLKVAPTDSTLYIIGYAGQRAHLGEAKARVGRAKDYLTRNRGIDSERIVTIDGGYREPAGVELFVTPQGKPKPLASPNVYPGKVEIIRAKNSTSNRRRY